MSNDSVPSDSPLLCYSPYLDERRLIRFRGRIDNATVVDFDVKRKIILTSNHYGTLLIISAYHKRFLYQNHETVFNDFSNLHYTDTQADISNATQQVFEMKAVKGQTKSINDGRATSSKISRIWYTIYLCWVGLLWFNWGGDCSSSREDMDCSIYVHKGHPYRARICHHQDVLCA